MNRRNFMNALVGVSVLGISGCLKIGTGNSSTSTNKDDNEVSGYQATNSYFFESAEFKTPDTVERIYVQIRDDHNLIEDGYCRATAMTAVADADNEMVWTNDGGETKRVVAGKNGYWFTVSHKPVTVVAQGEVVHEGNSYTVESRMTVSSDGIETTSTSTQKESV